MRTVQFYDQPARLKLCMTPSRVAQRTQRFHPHAHEFYELGFVRQGSCRWYVAGRASAMLYPGDCILIAPRTEHGEESEMGTQLAWVGFDFPGAPAGAATSMMRRAVNRRLATGAWREDMTHLVDVIVREQAGGHLGSEERVRVALRELRLLFCRCVEASSRVRKGGGRNGSPVAAAKADDAGMDLNLKMGFADSTDRPPEGGLSVNSSTGPDARSHCPPANTGVCSPRQQDMAKSAAHYFLENLARPLGVATVARYYGLSAPHFTTVFRTFHGVAPLRFLHEARLRRARDLLARGHLTVKEIAAQCGYVDAAHFCKRFKAGAGISPGAWRTSQGR